MMFRRSQDMEVESDSDWDDLTPPTQQQAPPSPSSKHTSGTELPVSNQGSHASPSTIAGYDTSPTPQLGAHHTTSTGGGNTQLQVGNATMGAHHTTTTGGGDAQLQVGNATMGAHHTTTTGGGDAQMQAGTATDSVQLEMTSILTVPTPHPPTAKIPPSAKSIYRVREEEEEEEGLDEGGRRKQRSHPPLEQPPQEKREEEKNHRFDLEFTTVSGQGVEYLTPSDTPPYAYMRGVANKCEKTSQRCVEEFYSSLRLVTDFIIIFILGSAQCLLSHVIRKLCCGLGHLFSDSIYKPGVILLFNGFVWPIISMCVQLSKGVVLIVGPLLEVVGVIMSWVVQIARACRLVTISNKTYQKSEA